MRIPAHGRLRDGVTVLSGAAGRDVLALEATPLRASHVTLEPATDLVWRLQAAGLLVCDTDGPTFDGLVDVLCCRLGRCPREVRAGAACRLDVVREVAFAALATSDADVRARATHLLAITSDNVAAECLRRLLRNDDAVVAREAALAVALRCPATAEDAHIVLAAARAALGVMRDLLHVTVDVPILVDLTSRRDAIPVTIVADAAPCTVVRIPWSRYGAAVLHHEIAHALAVCGSRWLSEGLAVWAQRQIVPGVEFPVHGRRARGQTPRFSLSEELAARDGASGRLSVADYRAAGDYVGWLVERHGFATFGRVFVACRAGHRAPVDAACRGLGFESLWDLEADWRASS